MSLPGSTVQSTSIVLPDDRPTKESRSETLPDLPPTNFSGQSLPNPNACLSSPRLLFDTNLTAIDKHVNKAKWKLVDWLYGTHRGQICALLGLGFFLNVFGALSWMSTGGNDDYDDSVAQSFWFSWGMFFDPGTQTGILSTEPVQIKIVAVIFSIFGFFYNLVVLGMFVEIVRAKLTQFQKRKNRLVANGHVLLLGWSEKTLFLLTEMLYAAENRGKDRVIVILADRDATDMWDDINQYFSQEVPRNIILRKGFPYEIDDLSKASASSAADIMVLGKDGTVKPRESDLAVIRIAVALSALPERPSGNIIAEARTPETLEVIDAIIEGQGGLCTGIITQEAITRVLCLMAAHPVLGDCFESLISYVHGEELYCKHIKSLESKTFGYACTTFDAGICIGIKPRDDTVIIAPPDEYIIGSGDRVLVIARDKKVLRNLNEGKKVVKDLSSSRIDTCTATSSGISHSGMDNDFPVRVNPKCIIIIGWPPDLANLLHLLDCCLPASSEVHILSELTQPVRDEALRSEIEALLSNISLKHYIGSTTGAQQLASLPLAIADSILVLAEGLEEFDKDGMASDSACLACLITVQGLIKANVAASQPGKQPHIVCEILDPNTQRMLEKNDRLKRQATFFHSNALEVGIFAQAAEHPAIFNSLLKLLQPNQSGDFALIPVERYMSAEELGGKQPSFWELWARVRQQGRLLVGWKQAKLPKPTMDPLPGQRDQPVPLEPSDLLVVIEKPVEDHEPLKC